MAHHISVFAVLFSAVSLCGAHRDSDVSFGLDVKEEEAEVEESEGQRNRPYERLCCLEDVIPNGGVDDVEASPNVSTLHMDVVKEHEKCILVMIPWGCQQGASEKKCMDACTDGFKKNPAWSEKVTVEAEKEQAAVEKKSAEEQRIAKSTQESEEKKCTDKEQADTSEVQRRKESDVKSAFDRTSQAVLNHKADDSSWRSQLSEMQGEMQKIIDDYEEQLKNIVTIADECRGNASSEYQAVVSRIEAANNKASQNVASWKKKFEDLTQEKENERSSSKAELGSQGACEVNGKLVDCCCSYREPADEDGNHAEGQAMKVKAGQFAEFEHCYAAQPYSNAKTGLFGMSGCKYYTKCDACWKLLCPRGGMCP